MGLLRQLCAARELKLTRDAAASNRMLGFRLPGDSIAPTWLRDESRLYAQNVHKQELRTRPSKAAKTEKVEDGAGRGGGKGRKGDGRGRGRGVNSGPPGGGHVTPSLADQGFSLARGWVPSSWSAAQGRLDWRGRVAGFTPILFMCGHFFCPRRCN